MDKAKEHNRLDKMIARTKELQKEIDHRHEVEEKVFELFSEGKFEEGDALLATLDDDKARELMEEEPEHELLDKDYVPYEQALGFAKASTFPNEELREKNFNRVNTDVFEKAVVLIKHWAEMMERVMFEEHDFRIEIKYNAKAKKTDFAIYTPTKSEKDDIQQEHSKG